MKGTASATAPPWRRVAGAWLLAGALVIVIAGALPSRAENDDPAPLRALPGGLRVAIDEAAAPISFRDDAGRASGLAVDLWMLARARLGWVATEPRPMPRAAALAALDRGDVDLLLSGVRSAQGERHAVFTVPYHSTTAVIVASADSVSPPHAVEDLAHRRVAIAAHHDLLPRLHTRYPGLRAVEASSPAEALHWVDAGAAEAAIVHVETAAALIESRFAHRLSISGMLLDSSVELRFMLRRDLAAFEPALSTALAQVIDADGQAVREKWLRQRPRAGRPRWLEMTLWIGGALASLLAVIGVSNVLLRREVRRRRAAEDQLVAREQRAQAMAEARKRFVAYLSHEARNLVGNIFGTLSLAEQRQHALVMPQLTRALRANAQALQDLLNNSLDAAQLDAGSFAVRATRVDLVALLEALAAEVVPTARHGAVLVGIDGTLAAHACCMVDGVRLAQIVRNLVGNALKYARRGEIRIDAGLMLGERADGRDRRLSVRVVDQGPGLSAEQQQRLFDEFTRIGGVPQEGSVGLGLTISRRLARAMGGDLRVSSAPGVGTTFSLCLPVVRCEDPPADPSGMRRLDGSAVPAGVHDVPQFSHFDHGRDSAGVGP